MKGGKGARRPIKATSKSWGIFHRWMLDSGLFFFGFWFGAVQAEATRPVGFYFLEISSSGILRTQILSHKGQDLESEQH